MTWYYADDSEQQREVEESQLSILVSEGTIQRDTLVWNESMTDWKPAKEVLPDLFGPVESTPPKLSRTQTQQAISPVSSTSTASPVTQTDPLAVIALVLGVLGLFCFQLLGLGAVICGHIAFNKASREGNAGANKGLALAGIITGYLSLVIVLIIVIFYGGLFWVGMSEGFDSMEFEPAMEPNGEPVMPEATAPELTPSDSAPSQPAPPELVPQQ